MGLKLEQATAQNRTCFGDPQADSNQKPTPQEKQHESVCTEVVTLNSGTLTVQFGMGRPDIEQKVRSSGGNQVRGPDSQFDVIGKAVFPVWEHLEAKPGTGGQVAC